MRVPGLHRRPLVRRGERGEHDVARVDVGEVAFHDLRLVADRPVAEVAPHRIDGLEPGCVEECRGARPVLVRERRPGEVDALHAPRLKRMEQEFVALGHAGSDAYAGLETFPNPGVERVEMVSDELTAFCPITHQPDFYTATIAYEPGGLCLESKSLKIYLSRFHDQGVFCEALAVQIRDEVAEALELDRGRVHVTLRQKARGGITITASV